MTDQASAHDELRKQLNEVAANTYCVNEKRPEMGYDRYWKLHVLWNDGTTSKFWARDDEGPEAVYQKALRDPRAVTS